MIVFVPKEHEKIPSIRNLQEYHRGHPFSVNYNNDILLSSAALTHLFITSYTTDLFGGFK